MRLKDFIKYKFNNLFYREYRLNRKVKKYLFPYYTKEASLGSNKNKMIIFMADGRKKHGGLADRLRGIVSTYKYCLENRMEFRVYFVSPFELEELLVPNEYDWRISKEDVSYNSSFSLPVYIDSCGYPEADCVFQYKLAERLFTKNYKQIHVYTNMYYADDEFGALFNRLFKPAPILQVLIDENLQKLGSDYLAVSCRFQNLLGDFTDKSSIYSCEEKEVLVNKCIAKIKELHSQHSEINKILVTADSEYFLKQISALDFVCLLPGKVGHMDHYSEKDISVHLKTFLDFYVLSRSMKIYLLVTGKMYKSGFAKRAAKLHDTPFEELIF